MIKALILDIDGTLYESEAYSNALMTAINKVVAEILGISGEEARAVLDRKRKQLKSVTLSVQSLGISKKKFYQELSEKIDPGRYLARNEKLREMLGRMRRSGLRVAALTNSGDPLAKKVLSSIGLSYSDFDTVVTSDETEPKPSPKAFLHALRKIGVQAQEAFYVGDRIETEITPAKKAGIGTVLVSREEVHSRHVDYRISSIMELEELFRTISS